ncbi:hypothetical protein EZS27_016533 [termite gut metagenome]|uniref:Uncharacterized protein n=1 Tax=termite gut metagenome TaxID=433724 RepID=A0A5J4RNC4_9ZZZZ
MENTEMKPSALSLNPFAKPKMDGFKLLQGITKVLTNAILKNYSRIPSDIIDTIFESIHANPSLVGWKLISRSLADAILQLIVESNHDYKENDIVIATLDKNLNKLLEDERYLVSMDFFNNPKGLPLLIAIKLVLEEYLKCFDFKPYESSTILSRFDSYFILSLRKEWGIHFESYKDLKGMIISPFDPAVKKEVEWNNYFIELEKEMLILVFSDSYIFGLDRVYIPLRACYKKRKTERRNDSVDVRINRDEINEKEKIVDAETYLLEWIQTEDKDDCIRIIHGGPGSGKSSFLKFFAAQLAKRRQKVLFVPLHRYDMNGQWDTVVNAFLRIVYISLPTLFQTMRKIR